MCAYDAGAARLQPVDVGKTAFLSSALQCQMLLSSSAECDKAGRERSERDGEKKGRKQ